MEGRVELKRPAGTKMRLREKGFPSVQDRGDQYLILRLEVPKNISSKHKKFIEDLRHFGE